VQAILNIAGKAAYLHVGIRGPTPRAKGARGSRLPARPRFAHMDKETVWQGPCWPAAVVLASSCQLSAWLRPRKSRCRCNQRTSDGILHMLIHSTPCRLCVLGRAQTRAGASQQS
jgi:hypothetical protein